MAKSPILQKWFHIINQSVQIADQSHPYSRRKDKSIFKDQLIADLEIKENKVLDISEERRNLFRIYYNDVYYNIFIETPDAGGANRRTTASQTTQKVAIPFHALAFQKIIKNYERVLVIDIYYPLKKEDDFTQFTLDKENRVYLISDPNSVYKSSVISKGTWNSVSH